LRAFAAELDPGGGSVHPATVIAVDDTGRAFGWRIELSSCARHEVIAFRETIECPAPVRWLPRDSLDYHDASHPSAATRTSLDVTGSFVLVSGFTICDHRWIEHLWAVSSSLPSGRYRLKVEITGYEPQRLEVTLKR
jgi:hypothetical protein